MRLTEDEKEICRQYGARDDDGNVHCCECPLVIDKREFICKANCTKEEWAERKETCGVKEERDSGDTMIRRDMSGI